jgi:hypothetical protein
MPHTRRVKELFDGVLRHWYMIGHVLDITWLWGLRQCITGASRCLYVFLLLFFTFRFHNVGRNILWLCPDLHSATT